MKISFIKYVIFKLSFILIALKCGPNKVAEFVASTPCNRTASQSKTCMNSNTTETYFSYSLLKSSMDKSCQSHKSCVYLYDDEQHPYMESVQYKHFEKLGLGYIKADKYYMIPLPLTKGCYIENTVPCFKTIYEGNWNIIERAEKALASRMEIETITGKIGHLKMEKAPGDFVNVDLEFIPENIDYDYDDEEATSELSAPVIKKGNIEYRSETSITQTLPEPMNKTINTRLRRGLFGSSSKKIKVGGVTIKIPKRHHHHHRRPHHQSTQKKDTPTKVELTNIKAPAFIYKIIKMKSSQEGMAFITSNNPYLKSPSDVRLMCSRNLCSDQRSFQEINKGFTYCCPVTEFAASLKRIYKVQLRGFTDANLPTNQNGFWADTMLYQ